MIASTLPTEPHPLSLLFFWLSALIENDYNFEGLFLIIYLICLYVTVLKNNYLLYC